ncbi:DUF371 domain-containing protein [Catenulispora sp. NF23]|uniref:DUF371 domain-containing protein n=1 Tax=Catenulispora pinistramenti TaxID=2705254 RepID=UPI001BA665BE|nr:DUF371 domain-containing protein [Catenulispora pinistramenti]MBS2534048.1 DUF371 domain-containing protein [Catenulispora pinistramenti]
MPHPHQAVLVGRGHPAIRATHAKTFELTAEPAITPRATCVLAVATVLDPNLAPLRGRVRLTLATPGLPALIGEATLNPRRALTDRAVIRRSRTLDADTLAVDSTLTADDLPDDFAAALTDPGREVTLTVEELGPERPLLRITFGDRTRLPAAKALVSRETIDVSRETVDLTIAEDAPPKEVATTNAVLERAAAAGARVAVPGPHKPLEALLATGLPPYPCAYLGSPQRLSTLPLTPVVFHMPVASSAALFAGRDVWIEDTSELDLGTAMTPTTAAAAVQTPGVLTVVGPAASDAEPVDLTAVARALTEAGIAPRTLTEALAPFGLTRKRLYALLNEQDQT